VLVERRYATTVESVVINVERLLEQTQIRKSVSSVVNTVDGEEENLLDSPLKTSDWVIYLGSQLLPTW
jgi:hypothetical protein